MGRREALSRRADLICDFWTEINRNLSAKLDAMGRPKLTPEQFADLLSWKTTG